MAGATVKIPAQHATAFYREAVDTLAFAASNLKEGAEWFMEGRGDLGRLEREDIPRALDAISLVERVRGLRELVDLAEALEDGGAITVPRGPGLTKVVRVIGRYGDPEPVVRQTKGLMSLGDRMGVYEGVKV